MKITQLVATGTIALLTVSTTYAEYPVISCSSDPAFSGNACNQCFDGWSIAAGESVGLLTDDLVNEKGNDIIIYKEEQIMPEMVSLSGDASWSQNPSSDGFWEYTDEFNATYSQSEDGYVVPSSTELTWLKSKLGYAYTLDTNSAAAGSNIWMLVYKLVSHDVSPEGDINIDGNTHNECVLFTSRDSVTPPPPPTSVDPQNPPAETLPETGAEHIFLILLALLLGFGFLKYMRKKA